MCKLLKCHVRERTQVALPAFFCIRGCSVNPAIALSAALVLVIAASGARAQTSEYTKPDVHLKGVSIERVDWAKGTADTKLLLEIENAGPAFKVKDLSYTLKLNDKQAADGKYDRDVAVPARSSATFELPCTVDLTTLPGVAWRIIAGGFEIHYELETEFTVPIFSSFNPRIKRSIGGNFSLEATVSGWTTKIKEHLSSQE